ncbi:hypothetical protein HanLR1_Chr03g0082161 [Helianthus annuus]|nr:hypothetical protein HanHA89_Chr03g0088981 [Helianthus annuus]KAJ0766836.1 hypothetical protein HanLR1_Chr03g0082161 [Helianthus annuus]
MNNQVLRHCCHEISCDEEGVLPHIPLTTKYVLRDTLHPMKNRFLVVRLQDIKAANCPTVCSNTYICTHKNITAKLNATCISSTYLKTETNVVPKLDRRISDLVD